MTENSLQSDIDPLRHDGARSMEYSAKVTRKLWNSSHGNNKISKIISSVTNIYSRTFRYIKPNDNIFQFMFQLQFGESAVWSGNAALSEQIT